MSQAYSVTAHYQKARDLYETLGSLGGDALLPANADKTRWYHTQDAAGAWDGRARPFTLARDTDALINAVDRVMYAAVNYAPSDYYVGAWRRYEWSDGREWEEGSNPMPDYQHLTAIAPFVDIDLTDEYKQQRGTDQFPRDAVERALEGYATGMAQLVDGDKDAVFALDSVGGAYMMLAPSITRPITDHFDAEARGDILEELTARVNEHMAEVRDRVHDDIPAVDGVLDPDMVSHKNRIFKAPWSLHADIDGVVHPLKPDDPTYRLVRPQDAHDGHLRLCEKWAEEYTDDYSDRVSDLVAALWPSYDGHGNWRAMLTAWLNDQQTPDTPPSAGGDGPPTPSDTNTPEYADTAPRREVYRALDNLDAQKVAEDTIVHRWNDDATSGKGKGFYPVWGPNSNGTANYVSDKIWHDTGSGDHGTVVEMALIGASDVSWPRGKIASGEDWIRGIRELRQLGYDVPLPEGDLPDDASPYYSVDLAGFTGADPYEDNMALLEACLKAREEIPELENETPPYRALVAIATAANLPMDDPDENILGQTGYSYAEDIFDAITEVDDL